MQHNDTELARFLRGAQSLIDTVQKELEHQRPNAKCINRVLISSDHIIFTLLLISVI
uniref:Uncharacterized protein n=1 Tax=Octopus bimaculoides TaxID=37653 RepID=A0A0L8HQJ2_OCTBM